MPDTHSCPRCGGALLWNGRGMTCISCSYHSAEKKPPSEKKIALPRKKKPDDGKK